MNKKPKLLIIGASGFLGWNLCQTLKDDYEIFGTYFRNKFELPGVQWIRINLLERQLIRELLEVCQADIVLNLAAISNVNFCQEHPALSQHINVYTAIAIAEETAKKQLPLIFTSTDLVFNGNHPPYTEDDFAFPLSIYGQQKQEAEEALIEDFDHVLVIRLPLLFGKTPSYGRNFLMEWKQLFEKGETLKAFVDEKRRPLSALEVGEWLKRIIPYTLLSSNDAKERLLNLSSNASISRYEMALTLVRLLNLEESLVQKAVRADINFKAPRPEDVSLDSSKAQQLFNYQSPSFKEQLQQVL